MKYADTEGTEIGGTLDMRDLGKPSKERPTLRDRLAMAALQGILASKVPADSWTSDEISADAYAQADSMLKARE